MQATFPLETSLGLSREAIASFLVFALTSSASAGPNNLLIMTIAGRSGLRSTLPSIAAITLAFGAMLVVGAIGGGIILQSMPVLTRALGTLGAGWMLYLAWSVACQRPDATSENALPHWSRALLLCWSNPKAWMMALTTGTAYLP
ncbi:LysE family transporter [Asaia sp. VD9]|uniref:LysE family translocator n=1 Tax=Asaia sp. VD9 TaxID=3081235 RepID=UPI00301A88D1